IRRRPPASPLFPYTTLFRSGVVVFHEQVLQLVAETTGVTLAQADEVRRALGTPQGQAQVESWWRPAAAARGYSPQDVDAIWEVRSEEHTSELQSRENLVCRL